MLSSLGLGEPSIGTFIIFAGVWINRNTTIQELASSIWPRHTSPRVPVILVNGNLESDSSANASLSKRRLSNLQPPHGRWRKRELRLLGYSKTIQTPNTAVWEDTIASGILYRFPFLMELIYWALIYGVYQMGRGRLAVWRTQHTVETSRQHALSVIWLEEKLHFFWEPAIQRFFLRLPTAMWWINRIYSYVHLPATVTFLVGLYWYAITRPRSRSVSLSASPSVVTPRVYESKRRALAMCNLLAFIIFSVWPCMPPRLLDDKDHTGVGDNADTTRKFGFVDTVHARNGAVSVWNQKKFTNQLAAMPSLHFGYALMIGLTVFFLPLDDDDDSTHARTRKCASCSWRRQLLRLIGFLYPFSILVAIVATANHFILDAIAGALICITAWHYNDIVLNLVPLEDCILYVLRVHKPANGPLEAGLLLPH